MSRYPTLQAEPGSCAAVTVEMEPRIKYTSDAVLEKLIAAGLGGTPRAEITPDMMRRALAGEVVKIEPPRPKAERHMCSLCHAVPSVRNYGFHCRECGLAYRKARRERLAKLRGL